MYRKIRFIEKTVVNLLLSFFVHFVLTDFAKMQRYNYFKSGRVWGMRWGECKRMVITYYVDVIFIFNLILDFALLLLIHPKQKRNYRRLFGAAGTGAMGAVLLLTNMIPIWSYMVLRLLIAGLMAGIGIPYKGIGELLCNTALIYGTGAALYGISFIFFGNEGVQNVTITYLSLLGSVLILFLGRCLYVFREKRKNRNIYRFEFILSHCGKAVKGRAFYDSGNHLYEPVSGWPVILVKEKVLKSLCIEKDKMRVIPYKAVGNTAGLLSAYPMEKLIVQSGGEKKTWINFYAAVVPDELLKQEECDVILHVSFV